MEIYHHINNNWNLFSENYTCKLNQPYIYILTCNFPWNAVSNLSNYKQIYDNYKIHTHTQYTYIYFTTTDYSSSN